MGVADVLDRCDGVYFCIKDKNSVFLWVNENFAELVGTTKEALIGTQDSRAAHVAHDKQVIASGQPLLNFHETIDIPVAGGGTDALEIVTQKGLLRELGGSEIIGITVCFSERFPDADDRANQLLEQLNLVPTTVGGHFAPGPRSNETQLHAALPERFAGDRPFYTTNYYLLKAGEVLRMHVLNADEQWFFHEGSAVRLHVFPEGGAYYSVDVGDDLDQGQVLHTTAPHNQWFGGELLGPGYALVSCSLGPGYDPRDSFTPTADQITALKAAYPQQAAIIDQLTQGS
jgi:uncharacterized protein